jgi:hypothetical protein
MAGKDAATGAVCALGDYLAFEGGAGTKPLDAVPVDSKGAHYYWSEENLKRASGRASGKGWSQR